MDTGLAKRRLLIGNRHLHYQLFKFAQGKTDGSIYITCPRFSETKWIVLSEEQGKLIATAVDSPGDGHISVHGSGRSSIRSNSDVNDRKLIIAGNYLLNLPKSMAGVRHLFTALLAEPSEAPVNARTSDYVIGSSKPLSPMALVFFAVPRASSVRRIRIGAIFHVDDLESTPPESGFGAIELVHHTVAWFAYKTKYMRAWPNAPHICFYDGFHVPAFMGRKHEAYEFILISPKYETTNEGLKISLSFVDPGRSSAQ
jgi:hypothetical protein